MMPRCCAPGCWILAAALVLASIAFGQTSPPAQAQAEPQTKPASQEPAAQPVAQPQSPASIQATPAEPRTVEEGTGRVARPVPVKAEVLEPNPDAKYVCEQPVAVHAPVWRGSQTLEFGFKIHNAGTADLQIRAKGG